LGGGGSVSIIVKIALLATYSPGILLSANTTINQTLSYANVSALNKYGTYRRISADNHTGTGSGSISHGLGTVPNINFWAQVSGNTTLNPTGWGSTGPVGDLGFSMDSTYLYYNVGSGTYSDAYYRLYKDN